MKIKVSEATPLQLNWLVATCEGEEAAQIKLNGPVHLFGTVGYRPTPYQPSTDWAQGGPILEREGITLRVNARVLGHWAAFIDFGGSNCNIKARHTGPTPLIAAMRCYVASKFGDEVEIPEELQ